MSRRARVIVMACVVALELVGVGFLSGVLRVPQPDPLPPCSDLASASSVQAALDAHPEFTRAVEAAGGRATVATRGDCGPGAPDAYLQVTYSDASRTRPLTEVVDQRPDLGVPVALRRV